MAAHGLIFDMDGVLFDSHPIHRKAWRQLLKSLGVSVSDEALDFILDGAKREEILQHFLGPLTAEQVAAYSAQKDAILKTQETDLQTVEGLESFLELVEAEAIPKGVATSATRLRTKRLLDGYRLTSRFKAIVTGDDVPWGKSNPAIFLKTAEQLGVPPGDVVVLEDAIPAIRAAKEVGMKCIGIATGPRRSKLLAAGAEIVVPHFKQLSLSDVFGLFSLSCSSRPSSNGRGSR